MAYIQKIPPRIFTHKIQLDEDCEPSVEHQRRLNPPMQEVVKTKIIKWLDASVVYPITDSPWVSPIQCVPKKGGITIVPNAKNELIPTRMVTGCRVSMDYRKLNHWAKKITFKCLSWIKCLTGLREGITIIFWMATQGTIKSLFPRKIKRKQHSLVRIGLLLLRERPLGYAIHPQPSNVA
ncbi:uncharacterized protein LOC132066492 [Lycium ferocissimum]|uniref:uncharacterized protein LOC132066492 n=1 Tax=Lycium ferocissimum TaxID=112874 RepID=UPI0028164EB7|nr:uncharacterized protein LOC132066492 [Lycium ferocissimum]